MTSSAPLIDLLFERLEALEPGALSRLSAAERYDLDVARRSSPAERLAALNDLLIATDALTEPGVDPRPIEYHTILL